MSERVIFSDESIYTFITNIATMQFPSGCQKQQATNKYLVLQTQYCHATFSLDRAVCHESFIDCRKLHLVLQYITVLSKPCFVIGSIR